jgi:hypothetical protein
MNIDELKIKISQDANCLSSEEELMEITYTSDLGLNKTDGGFFIIKTEKWSLEIGELDNLFNKIILATKELIGELE